jgi:hypothetical protein
MEAESFAEILEKLEVADAVQFDPKDGAFWGHFWEFGYGGNGLCFDRVLVVAGETKFGRAAWDVL